VNSLRTRISEVDMNTPLRRLPRLSRAATPARTAVAAWLLLLLLTLLPPGAGAQSADDGYRPDANGSVYAMVVQPDGKLIVGGAFQGFAGYGSAWRLGRVNPDGSVDRTFAPNPDDNVHALALQPDGKVIVGGDFFTIAAQPRVRLARVNPDGSLDEDFVDVHPNDAVEAIAVQPDGKLIVAGRFDNVTGVSRIYLVRLHAADGSIDASFNPQLSHDGNGWVTSLALQPDGKLIIGGGFESVGGHPSRRVARLNSDGSADTSFTANAESDANALALQPDGKILVATTYGGISRLNADGSPDSGFDVVDVSGGLTGVSELALEADGSVLIGGDFSHVNGQARRDIARVHHDGSLDDAFAPVLSDGSDVHALAVQADGKPVIGGFFTAIDGHTVYDLARLYPDGRLDATWTLETPTAQETIGALAVQPDGKWVVGGWFTHIGGQARNFIARVNADGSVDTAFNPNANNIVNAVVVQPDGKLLVGGYFGTIGGVPSSYVARLNADGTGDGGFHSDIEGSDSESTVSALLLQPDGKIVVAGNFYTVAGEWRPYLARLDSEGHLDAAFNPNPNDYVYALALQDDGKLLVGGVFSMIGGQARNGIARFNADGSLDTAYDPNANGGGVFALAVQADGKVVVGGFFTAMGGVARNRIARLHVDGSVDGTYDPNANGTVQSLVLESDGRLLAGGAFTEIGGAPRNRMARISYGGGADTAFDPDADSPVFALGLQFDGKAVAAGGFTHIGGLARGRIARLSTPEAAQQVFEVGGGAVTWLRSDRGAEVALPPQLLVSTDNAHYDVVGTMQRTDGGWRYEGFTPPPDREVYWLRVRGPVRSGALNGSGGLIETTRIVHVQGDGVSDVIFANGFE
jgi:uncharacterized delta-60 repeat protein